jgi:hypothetical protein
MAKEYDSGTNSVFKTMGSSNHVDSERQNEDFYSTDLKVVKF